MSNVKLIIKEEDGTTKVSTEGTTAEVVEMLTVGMYESSKLRQIILSVMEGFEG